MSLFVSLPLLCRGKSGLSPPLNSYSQLNTPVPSASPLITADYEVSSVGTPISFEGLLDLYLSSTWTVENDVVVFVVKPLLSVVIFPLRILIK